METLLEVKPDLIIASSVADLEMDKLREGHIPVYVPPNFCGKGGTGKATFAEVYKELDTMAAIFGKQDKAKDVANGLKERVKKVKPAASGTAAAVYVTPGDTRFFSYGTNSMITPELEAVGLANAFDAEKKRVFEVSMEALLEKNPDYIVVLYQKDEKGAVDTFKSTHGALDMKSVKANQIITLPFPLVDPPSPLSIRGMEKLAEALTAKK